MRAMRTGLLHEVVPEHTGRILQDSHINRDHRGILLNDRPILTELRSTQLAQLTKTGGSPVVLLGGEPVMCI